MKNNRNVILRIINSNAYIKVPKFLIPTLEVIDNYLLGCMIEHATYHLENGNSDGWFYLTFPQIKEYFNVNKNRAVSSIQRLCKLNIIEKKNTRKLMDHKCYYRINEATLLKYVDKYYVENTNKIRGTETELWITQNQPMDGIKPDLGQHKTSHKQYYNINNTISDNTIKDINNNNIEIENDTTVKSHAKHRAQDIKIVNVVPPPENDENDNMYLSGDDIMAYEPVGIEVDKKS